MAIKEFFKSIGQNVKNASEKVAGKIDDTATVQKLKYRIGKKEEEITEIYKKLGERVIAAVYAEEDFDEDIATAIAKIEAIREEIASMDAERREKENHLLCPACQHEMKKDCDFCPKCGAKIEKPADTQDDGASGEEETTEDTTVS